MYETQLTQKGSQCCIEYTQLQKQESSFFSLHFGTVKPVISLYIALRDTPVPTRGKESHTRFRGQKEVLKRTPPMLPLSRYREEQEMMMFA